MIALVTAGGGGDAAPVYFTVPWSPSIAARGQLPGRILNGLLVLRRHLSVDPEVLQRFTTLGELECMAIALTFPGYGLLDALGVTLARRLMLEIGLIP